MTLRDTLTRALRSAVTGRAIVLLGRLPKSAEAPVGLLRAAGAGPFLRVSLRGGAPAGAADIEPVVLEPGPAGPDFILEVAAFERRLAAPRAPLLARLRAFDPDGRALVIGPNHLHCEGLDGRPRLGGRTPLDLSLEDKTTIDALWDTLGLARLPSRIATTDDRSLAAAAAAIDRGDGTVWAADNTTAVEGGAIGTRWVHDAHSAAEARALLAPRCRTVRIMPFVPGLPVSIHAWCLERGVAVLSPMEMVVLRHRRTGAFRFCGIATTWSPPHEATDSMRRFARAAARHLHARGYRGALSIDGVLGADGFVPTELNARFPAGLSQLAQRMDGLPLALADALIREGGLAELSPAGLQAVLRAGIARHPIAWLHSRTPRAPSLDHAVGLVWRGDAFARAEVGEPAATTLHWREGQVGGALRLDLPAPPRGVTGARLFTAAIRAAGGAIAEQMAGWTRARPAA
jgi:hypothetical protein